MHERIVDPHISVRAEVDGSQTPTDASIAKLVGNGDETTVKYSRTSSSLRSASSCRPHETN
jgi:hypothetical protein